MFLSLIIGCEYSIGFSVREPVLSAASRVERLRCEDLLVAASDFIVLRQRFLLFRILCRVRGERSFANTRIPVLLPASFS